LLRQPGKSSKAPLNNGPARSGDQSLCGASIRPLKQHVQIDQQTQRIPIHFIMPSLAEAKRRQ